ncbi:MAG TPA: hypothetical protein VJ732_01700, partial [Bryobacteraceae bacterium]|nr:hypothetical protein [Bryobacteraceae bacterium]
MRRDAGESEPDDGVQQRNGKCILQREDGAGERRAGGDGPAGVGADGLGAAETSYLPYGEEEGNPTTADGIEKFGTYFRDSTSLHQDYADQRYYNP